MEKVKTVHDKTECENNGEDKIFISEIQENFHKAVPCDYLTAVKNVRKFAKNNDFGEFWNHSVAQYFPAVKSGVMLLSEEIHSHETMLSEAKKLLEEITYSEVLEAFLYSLETSQVEYRPAIVAYLYLKNLPQHDLREKKTGFNGETHRDNCPICGYRSPNKQPKMSFYWANNYVASFYLCGGLLDIAGPNLNSCVLYLKSFKKMPKAMPSENGLAKLIAILKLASTLEPNKKVGAYIDAVRKAKILPKENKDCLEQLFNILGFLNILHTEKYFGGAKVFTPIEEQPDPIESKNDFQFPIRFWRAKNGVDKEWAKKIVTGDFSNDLS